MTNKEAIDILNNRLNTVYFTSEDLDALDLAIKALEEVEGLPDNLHREREQAYMNGYEDAKKKYARPTGKWIESKEHIYTNESCKEWTNFYCSECDVPSISPSIFCPNCGADMRKEEEND